MIPTSPPAATEFLPNRAARRAAARRSRRRATGAALAAGSLAITTGAMVVGTAAPAGAATLTVTNTNDSGGGSLREALANANDGDTIVFDGSVTGEINLLTTLDITDGVTITGPGSAVLAIDGQDTVRIFEVNPANAGQTVRISGLLLKDGRTSSTGGAIRFDDDNDVDSDALELVDILVESSFASKYAGAVYTDTVARVLVSGSTFSNNEADYYEGGAIYVGDAVSLTVTDSVFIDNLANDEGGAIRVQDTGTVAITGSRFTNNQSEGYNGGAVALYNVGTATVTDSTFVSNRSGDDGGALYMDNDGEVGSLTITNTLFSQNSADNDGGGVAIDRIGSLTVSGSTFLDNHANTDDGYDGEGGGLYLEQFDTTVLVENSTFSGNQAVSGGGLVLYGYSDPAYLPGESITLRNVTVVDNHTELDAATDSYGGGASLGEAASITVEGSVFANNGSAGGTGGLLIFRANVATVSTTTISGNSAAGNVGGLYLTNVDDFTVRNTTISANSAGGDGGGVAVWNPGSFPYLEAQFVNSTISGNVAGGEGGAIFLGAGTLVGSVEAIPAVPAVNSSPIQIVESTITANVATTVGGIYVDAAPIVLDAAAAAEPGTDGGDDSDPPKTPRRGHGDAGPLVVTTNPGRITLNGAIVSANTGLDVGACACGGVAFVDAASSILGATGPAVTVAEGAGVIRSSDPGLEPLADNGGPTLTHALKLSSPAVDAGSDPVPSFPGSEFDQRGPGYARVVNGKVDIGAFEIQPPKPRFTG